MTEVSTPGTYNYFLNAFGNIPLFAFSEWESTESQPGGPTIMRRCLDLEHANAVARCITDREPSAVALPVSIYNHSGVVVVSTAERSRGNLLLMLLVM